jgi:DNA-binding IclR family transcriptional regulator
MQMVARTTQKYSLLTLQKGFAALELIAESSNGMGVTELSSQMSEPVTVVFRILRTLSELGCVMQDPRTKRYGLGMRIWELSEKAVARLGIVEIAQPILARLTQLTGETSSLAVVQGNEFLYVASVNGQQPLRAYVPPGSRTPLSYPTASGRVIVAHSKPEVIDAVLDSGLKRFTTATITDVKRVRTILANVRKNGVAVVHGEYQQLLSAIAAPIFNPMGDCVAAIAISGVTQGLAGASLPNLVETVKSQAENFNNALRGMPPPREMSLTFSARR